MRRCGGGAKCGAVIGLALGKNRCGSDSSTIFWPLCLCLIDVRSCRPSRLATVDVTTLMLWPIFVMFSATLDSPENMPPIELPRFENEPARICPVALVRTPPLPMTVGATPNAQNLNRKPQSVSPGGSTGGSRSQSSCLQRRTQQWPLRNGCKDARKCSERERR